MGWEKTDIGRLECPKYLAIGLLAVCSDINMIDELPNIRRLVGKITKDELRYVDSFVGEHTGLFMPVGGACFYALTPLHSHPSYMFVLPFNDETSIKMGESTIRARPAKVFALSPGIAHQELPSDSPPRYIAIFVNKDFFEKELSHYSVKQDITFHGELFDATPALLPALKRFMIEANGKGNGSDAMLDALSVELCHILIRGIFPQSKSQDRITLRVEVDRAVEYMHLNIDKKITVQDLSAAARMSATHFTRIFKKEIGNTPMEYLNRIRMERAKKLLMAGDKTITEVAFECGFTSLSHLSASFRKFYKISPGDYLKSLKKV